MKKIFQFLLFSAFMLNFIPAYSAQPEADSVKLQKWARKVSEIKNGQEAKVCVEEYSSASSSLSQRSIPVVIDFNADWCGPCRQFKPVFHSVAEAFCEKAEFVSVNIDNYGELAQEYKVNAIPCIVILFPDGTILQHTGYMDEEEFTTFVNDSLK